MRKTGHKIKNKSANKSKSTNKSATKNRNRSVRKGVKENAKESAKDLKNNIKKETGTETKTENETAAETVKESKIKPVEPMEPVEPIEPIGGRYYGSEPEDGAVDVESSEGSETVAEGGAVAAVKAGGKKKKISIYDTTFENDIRYKGILSYRHFRIAAWICMAFTIANIFLGVGMKLSPAVAEKYSVLNSVFSFFAEFSIFLFLFANFAVIIDKKSTYKKLFILYGVLTVGFVLLFVIVYYRYLGGLAGAIAKSSGDEVDTGNLLNGGFKAFNVFLDMLLCTAVIFFIDYRPKKYFVGKKIYIFRAFAAIPIIYELGCILLKYFSAVEGLHLHPMVSPFLTTKPVFCFLLFVRMAFYVKGRETKFLKQGKTLEEYNAFLKTNRNSFQFSKKFALMALIYGLLDFAFVVILFILRLANAGVLEQYTVAAEEEVAEVTTYILTEVKAIGFGGATMMIFIAPFILLFSYTKSYKKSKIDMLIPIAAVVVIGLIVLEGIFRVLCLVPDRAFGILETFLGG